MLLRALLPLVAAAAAAASESESELTFVDLRLHGGINATTGHGAALTLMCGNIGDKDPHVVDSMSDIGIVIGARFIGEHVDAKPDAGGAKLQENVLALDLLGGIGAYMGSADLLEIVAGYGLGQDSDGTRSGFHKRGTTKTLSLEIGWYHTMAKHWQVGGLIGYERTAMKIEANGGEFRYVAMGVNAAVELGYRF